MDPPIPSNFNVGTARGGGDCFYDSFAQCLNQQQRRNKKQKIDAKSLRLACKKYAQQVLLKDKHWLREALEYENQSLDYYILYIEYCADERTMQPIWGRPEIEGRIICGLFKVRLHVIEKHIIENEEICVDEVVDRNGSRSVNNIDYFAKDIAHIINKGSEHFEPVLRSKAGISNPINAGAGHNKATKILKEKSSEPIEKYPAKGKTSGGRIAPTMEKTIPEQHNTVQLRKGYGGIGDKGGKQIWHDKIVDESGHKPVESVDYDEDDTMHIVDKGDLHFDPILKKVVDTPTSASSAQEIPESEEDTSSSSTDSDEQTTSDSEDDIDDSKAKLGLELMNVFHNDDSETEQLASIRKLLDQGADINFSDPNGQNNTALHYAVRMKSKKVIKLLLEYGADKSIKNGNNKTPMDLATRSKKKSVIEVLNKQPNNARTDNKNTNDSLLALPPKRQTNVCKPVKLNKAEMEENIDRGVREHHSLEKVKDIISQSVTDQLSEIEYESITGKYITLCFKLWFQEVREILKESSHISTIPGIADIINGINDFVLIPAPFQGSFYELLIGHDKFITKETKTRYVSLFKEECKIKLANIKRQKMYSDDEIEDIIKKKVSESKCDIDMIKSHIVELAGRQINDTEDEQIEQMYITIMLELFLQEANNVKLQNIDFIQEIDRVNRISQISEMIFPFNELDSYKCLKKLLLSRKEEVDEASLRKFKSDFLTNVLHYADDIKREISFLDAFSNFLNSIKDTQMIITALQLQQFCSGSFGLEQLLMKVNGLGSTFNNENLHTLKDATEGIGNKNMNFLEKVKEIIGNYIKPVDFQTKTLDGRLVIEVIGNNITISNTAPTVEEQLLTNPDVQEVHFVAAAVVHNDKDIKDPNIWHGKNIIVVAKVFKIHDDVTWNVSGKDSDCIYRSRANDGDGVAGQGQPGKDGTSGESGGNVFIRADEIINGSNFKIISEGGKGGKGQDGGNGNNGEDGHSIELGEFKEKFPTSSKQNRSDEHPLLQNVKNIREDMAELKTACYNGHESTKLEEIIEGLTNLKGKGINTGAFMQLMNKKGNEITFSFMPVGNSTKYQSYLLCKGSVGRAGGAGGEYGLGGEGGYAGDITILVPGRKPLTIAKPGENGRNGIGGLYGRHGKNGWDMGYMHLKYSKLKKLLPSNKNRWPEYFGVDDEKRLQLHYSDKYNTSIVTCYDKHMRDCKYRFARIIDSAEPLKTQKAYQERVDRTLVVRQGESKSSRKKAISRDTVHNLYVQNIQSNYNLNSTLNEINENKNKVLKEMAEQKTGVIQEKTKITVQRRVESKLIGNHKHYRKTASIVNPITIKPLCQYSDVVNKLKENSIKSETWMNDWLLIKHAELSISQINELFSYFQDQKAVARNENLTEDSTGITTEDVLYIEQILKAKYQLAIFAEIPVQVQQYIALSYNTLESRDTANYLTERTNDKNKCKISHEKLGTLDNYILQRKEEQDNNVRCVHDLCKTLIDNLFEEFKKTTAHLDANNSIAKQLFEELRHPGNAALAKTLQFCLSEGILGNSQIDVKKYTDKYNDMLQKEKHGLITFPESYMKLNFESCSNKSVVKILLEDIRKGPNSSSYREILARIFDVNIRLYIRNLDNTLNALSDHNPAAEKKICYSISDGQFAPLELNESYLRMMKERKSHCALYKRKVEDIYMQQRKEDCDEYMKNKSHLLKNDNSYEQLPSYIPGGDFADIVRGISLYCSETHLREMNERLGKLQLSSHISGIKAILCSILNRFECEGIHVSVQEIFYLIDCILTSVTEEKDELDVYFWIVSAHQQRNWIVELLLLDLENYFKTKLNKKDEWRKCLLSIENKYRYILLLFKKKFDDQLCINEIPIHCVDNILVLLCNISNDIADLSHLPLTEWIIPLKESYFQSRLLKLTNCGGSEILRQACYYLLSIENVYGNDLTSKLIEILEEKWSEISEAKLDILVILGNIYSEYWNLDDIELKKISSLGVAQWIDIKDENSQENHDRNIDQLTTLMKDNSNSSRGIIDKLAEHKVTVNAIKKSYQHLMLKYPDSILTAYDLKLAAGDEIFAIAQIMKFINIQKGFTLRDTQILAIIILLKNKRKTLLQVSTGEGKSLIAVAAAIVKALKGEKSDIVTSSSVLAKRDAKDNRDIYKKFGISVSHNCSNEIEQRKQVYSSNHVVYGDIASFQRDYLLDRFYQQNILGDRNFENVIIDEVDSMLLDNGNNVLYLSHDVAGLDKLEPIYVYIWEWINTPAFSRNDISNILNAEKIKQAILDNLKCTIQKEDIKMIDSSLGSQTINNIWEHLIKLNVLDSKGNIKINQSQLEDVVTIPHSSNEAIIDNNRVRYLINQRLERKKHLQVPNYLKPFVEQHLSAWIDNAIKALFMKVGRDYVLDVDRTGTSKDLNSNITIIDRDTGTDQANSQWDEALHQFLQLKHGCKLYMQSLKAVFISNVAYFKLYRKLSGFTGTLGSKAERELLQVVHEVDFVTIPTSKQKIFDEREPCICKDQYLWIDAIVTECEQIVAAKRSCLIICETISEVETLYQELRVKYGNRVHAYKRDYEQLTVANCEEGLQAGQIIIATNLAGRGTDIRLAEDLKLSGGLHVCLTYLPSNTRIEQQAYGRSARCGDKGSGKLIVIEPEVKQSAISHMIALKTERDNAECQRLAQIKQYYYEHINREEQLFHSFADQYGSLRKAASKIEHEDKELMEIVLNSCLDRWAFWLDTNSEAIKKAIDTKNTSNLHSTLKTFLDKLKVLQCEDVTHWITMDHDNIHNQILVPRAIQMGKRFAARGNHDQAIKLFDQVIDQEPYFSEAAHYYKAFSIIKLGNPFELFEKELIKAAKLFDYHKTFAVHASTLIDSFKQSLPASILQIDAYKEQKEKEYNIFHLFSQTIENVVGHAVTPQSFISDSINENLALVIYNDLLKSGILEKANINFSEVDHDFKYCCYDYGIHIDQFETFLKGYDGLEIDEKSFEKKLVENIALPSQEALWALLIQEKVFCNEQKYIAIKKGTFQQTTMPKEVCDIHESKYEYDTYALLHANFAEQDNILYEKEPFKRHFGENIYKILKDRNQWHIVKKANIPSTDFPSVQFPYYDSITLDDFKKTNIKDNDAQIILLDLVNQGILQKQKSDNKYRLKMQLGFVKLPTYPLYEKEVRALLSNCFAYRIALHKMERIAKKGIRAIRLPLLSNPHQDLTWELVSQNIISPVKVSCKPMNTEKMLKEMYPIHLTEREIYQILPIPVRPGVMTQLVQNGWLHKLVLTNKFKINSCEKETQISFSNHDQEIIRQAFNHRLQLSNEETIQSILNSLKTLRIKYNDSTKHDFCLKPISGFFEAGQCLPTEEMHIFSLNGLNDLLAPLTEQKTIPMYGSAIWVTAIGTCQIVTSVALQLLTFSAITKFGSKFIREGTHDIKYAANALKSGHFDWNDYAKQKIKRLLKTSTASFNAAADLQEATLSDEDFVKSDPEPTILDIVRHVIPATASSIDQVNLGMLIESHVREFCEGITEKVLCKLEKHSDIPSFRSCLHTAHIVFGNSVIDGIEKLSEHCLSQKTLEYKWLDVSQEITHPITHEFTEFNRKLLNTGTHSLTTLNELLRLLAQKYKSIAFDSIDTVIRKFISDLTVQINQDFPCETYVKQDADCEKCLNVKFHFLKSWLREKTKKYIIEPILAENIHPLTKIIRKKMAKILKSHRLVNDLTYFTELKARFYNDPQNSNEELLDPIAELEIYFTKTYNEKLLKLRSFSNDPKLLAVMIEYNGPMDMECLKTFVNEISCMTNQTGIPSVRFIVIVEGECAERRTFSSASKSAETKFLYLEPDKNSYGFIDKNNNIKNYDCIINFLSLHVYKDSTEEKIKSDIITFLKQRTSKCSQSRKKCIEECYLNEDEEMQTCYEHALWKYNPSTDVDLRNAYLLSHRDHSDVDLRNASNEDLTDVDPRHAYPLSHEEDVISQLSKAYNIALCKINEKLEELDSNPYPMHLEFCEFTTTTYGVIKFPHNKVSPNKQIEANFPIQFKAKREVRIPDVKNNVLYHMTIDCNINLCFAAIGLPYGPHVRYRVGRVGRIGPDGVTGFVLLNANDGIFCMRNGVKMQRKYTFKPSNIFCKRLDRTFSKSLTELHLKLPHTPKDLKAEPNSFSASIETCKRGSKALTSVPIASDYWNYNWKQGKNKLK